MAAGALVAVTAPRPAAALSVENPRPDANVGALDVGLNTVALDIFGECNEEDGDFDCFDFNTGRFTASLPSGRQLDSLVITVTFEKELERLRIQQETVDPKVPAIFSFFEAPGSGELLNGPLFGELTTLGIFRLFTADAREAGDFAYRATYNFTVSETVAPIPLPPAAALLLSGVAALGLLRARRR